MDDRTMLKYAAKASGLSVYFDDLGQCCKHQPRDPMATWLWNPLTDSADALELAVTLGLAIIPYPIYAQPKHSVVVKQYKDSMLAYRARGDVLIEEIEVYGNDPAAATRRAIVRAAALIGQASANADAANYPIQDRTR